MQYFSWIFLLPSVYRVTLVVILDLGDMFISLPGSRTLPSSAFLDDA